MREWEYGWIFCDAIDYQLKVHLEFFAANLQNELLSLFFTFPLDPKRFMFFKTKPIKKYEKNFEKKIQSAIKFNKT